MTLQRINRKAILLLALLSLGLGGCVSMPTGPSRAAMPGTGKNFDQFRADDGSCRQYATEYSGASPAQTQENAAVKSAAIGTVLGAAAGAAIGNSSASAGAGAGIGLLMGALSGSAAGNQSGYMVQRRYDDGYAQCMYAKGHRVAVRGAMTSAPAQAAAPVAPAPTAQPYYPPPAPSANQPTPPQTQAPYYAAPPPPGSAPPPPSAIVR
jgi:Glycine-zipper domain